MEWKRGEGNKDFKKWCKLDHRVGALKRGEGGGEAGIPLWKIYTHTHTHTHTHKHTHTHTRRFITEKKAQVENSHKQLKLKHFLFTSININYVINKWNSPLRIHVIQTSARAMDNATSNLYPEISFCNI